MYLTAAEPKRKAHTKVVLRELFAKSGNICAMSGCSQTMVTADGKFVGQICHIEGVKGERSREGMTPQELADVSNLVLLCYPHHIETNDEATWSVEKMQRMKADHEALFTDVGMRLYDAYYDTTSQIELTKCRNAGRFCDALDWGYGPVELEETAADINALFEKMAKLDLQSRRFICAVVERAEKIRETANLKVEHGHLYLRWKEFAGAYDRDDDHIKEQIEALEAHHLGGHDVMEVAGRDVDAIVLYATENGWSFWQCLGEFCATSKESLEQIVVKLELSRLDR